MELGLASSRQKAQGIILAGQVLVNGRVASKAGLQVGPQDQVQIKGPEHPFVSRGGVKLAGALDHFGLAVEGLTCLDVGASTGGFCDCLLKRGAARVTALDVGRGQLHFRLRGDPRVENLEGYNARLITPQVAPGPFDLITVDVSFISLTLVLGNLVPRLGPGGGLLALVKPQFEAGRRAVGKGGGVVRDPAVQQAAVDKVSAFMASLGLVVAGSCPSPLKGPKGNQEHFVLARRADAGAPIDPLPGPA